MPSVLEPLVKRAWRIDSVQQIPRAVSGAFNAMRTGRPGPALITLPMDVQADSIDVDDLPDPTARRPHHRSAGDPDPIRSAAAMLINAQRPVIVAGGGVILSDADAELRQLAEHLGACVVTTMQGKSVFPEDHPLYAWHMGSNGTTCGNHMTTHADVILAVGVRFADKATSSYRPGYSFSIPPTKLIHVDIDPYEIGKNYPVEIGIEGDAKAVLAGLVAVCQSLAPARIWQAAAYTREIGQRVTAWFESSRALRSSEQTPATMGRALTEVRAALPPEAIILTSSGNAQAQVFQEMAFALPRTYISAGGFSTMGWSYPAALGAKLAAPDKPVVALVGDGDFLMTFQEIATAVQYNIPAVAIVLNNQGWQAIRDLQRIAFGPDTDFATMFEANGQPQTPHIADAARAFGAYAARISDPGEIAPALRAALDSGCPAVIEVMVDMSIGTSGGAAPGWWDVPIPEYYSQGRAEYERGKREEKI
jgi:acetolactate synthase-1/2/3 large subunit